MQNLFERNPSASQRQSRQTQPAFRCPSEAGRTSSEQAWKRMGSRGRISHSSQPPRRKRETFRGDASSPFRWNLYEDDGNADKNSLDLPGYQEFITRVNCPFCWEVQSDKVKLIKHLDEGCRGRPNRRGHSIFQIYPDNNIKCNFCSAILRSFELYLIHLHSEKHVLECSKTSQTGEYFNEFLFCSCCRVQVGNSNTQLQCHLQNVFHQIKSRSARHSEYYRKKNIFAICCFYNNKTRFQCLCCPSSDFLFSGPQEIILHMKSPTHIRNVQSRFYLNLIMYCCFCDEEVLKTEILYHFSSKEHKENEDVVTSRDHFQICFYCGCMCDNLRDLSNHMKSNCEEINIIRQQEGWEERKAPKSRGEHEFKEDKTILVTENVDIVELLKVLNNFGKISYVKTNSNGTTLIEFQKKTSLELIFLAKKFITVNGKRVDIKLPGVESKAECAGAVIHGNSETSSSKDPKSENSQKSNFLQYQFP